MTDIRKSGGSAATLIPEQHDDLTLMQPKDEETQLLQTLNSLPEAGAKVLLERLKREGRVSPDVLKTVEERFKNQLAQQSKQADGPVMYSADNSALSAQRRAESGQAAMLQQMQLRKRLETKGAETKQNTKSTEVVPAQRQVVAAGVGTAKAAVQSRFNEIEELGRSIAEGKGPVSEEEKKAWEKGQEDLRQSVTDLAAKVAHLPADSPERAAAQEQIKALGEKLTEVELPALARMNPEFGESYNAHHSKVPGSDGAALPGRMKMYGISEKEMNEYITTGKESPGLSKAIGDAKRTGEWPALGVVRAAYQQRADYLRATTSKDDKEAHKQAADLDSAAASLTRNRGAIQLNHQANSYSRLAQKYPDESKRPEMVKTAMKEAKTAVAHVGKQAAEQLEKHPERYGKNSTTRKLAGDAMSTEANIMNAEAQASMEAERTKLQEKAKAEGSKTVAPPALHPDLEEGGAVDKKRAEAVKIDPSLGDVVKGGDRAVRFAQDRMQTKKARLDNSEQQIAHQNSVKPDSASPELVAKRNKQLDSVFKSALETNQKLAAEKPGSLSLAQTGLLTETAGDMNTLSRRISAADMQKHQVKSQYHLDEHNRDQAGAAKAALDNKLEGLQHSKIERVQMELAVKMDRKSAEERARFEQNPAEYVKNLPDTKEEAEYRSKLTAANKEVTAQLNEANKKFEASKAALDRSKKIDDSSGVLTPGDILANDAAEALKRSEAHLKAIPEKGPERVPRLNMLMEHQSAVIGVSTTIRDNADAKVAHTNLQHQITLQAWAGETPGPGGETRIGTSTANLAKVTADAAQAKRGAYEAAKAAGAETDRVRKDLVKEAETAYSKQPADIQKQNAGELQSYKDSLAARQVYVNGALAEMAADVDAKESLKHLQQGTQIINDELPLVHVARLDQNQAKLDHARNEARMNAQALLGESGVAVARRAQTVPNAEYGMLVVDSLNHAGNTGSDLHRTLTIDGGGAAEATASKKVHQEMRSRGDAILKDVMDINKIADVNELADKLEAELANDVKDFKKTHEQLSKEVTEQRKDAFGILANAGGRLRGVDMNQEALKAGLEPLDAAAGEAEDYARQIRGAAEALRAMKARGIPDHVIMATLRDPRLNTGERIMPDEVEALKAWKNDFDATRKRYGVQTPMNPIGVLNTLRSSTPFGNAMDSTNSNATRQLVDYLGNKHTDLLAKSRNRLTDAYLDGQEQWKKVTPYAALSHAPDQIIMALGSSYAMAGVFARAATLTRIPRVFNAARGLAAGMSTPAKLMMLGGVNAAEAGLGMATGEAFSAIGKGVFGKNSFGAKAFEVIGSGFQLSAGSKVALRSGLEMQAALGLTMHGVPVTAQLLGADPELAAKIGMATGVFMPTVLGTMGNFKTVKRAENVMVNELGIDPRKAKALMGDIFHAESHIGGDLDIERYTRERAGKIVDGQLPHLTPEARTNLLDTMTMDAVRKKVPFEPPKSALPEQVINAVENHFSKLQNEMVKKGVAPERAKHLAESEKTAMFEEVLNKTNAIAQSGAQARPRGNTPETAATATRDVVRQVSRDEHPEVQVLHTVRNKDGVASGQQVEGTYRLLHMDPSNKKAVVVDANGVQKQVDANNVVYIHDGQALGVMPPAVKARFEHNLNGLNETQKQEWSEMMGAAHKKSPEHVQLIRQLLAGDTKFERIKDWHKASLNLSQRELGQFVSPGMLPQHLISSCAAACAQKIHAILNPEMGAKLRNKKFAAEEQQRVLQDNGGKSETRDDFFYRDIANPPLMVRVEPIKNPPSELQNALKVEKRENHEVYEVGSLDRREIGSRLEELSDLGTVIHTSNGTTSSSYEVEGVRSGADGKELHVRKIGEENGEWVKVSDLYPKSDGSVQLPNGEVLTHIAVPQGERLKGAENGMILENDPKIQDMIRAATGKNIRGHKVDGEGALQAIQDSVKDIGFAGVEVKFPAKPPGREEYFHQILVLGSKEKDGKLTFDVYDPTHGTTRSMSGEELLNYSNGKLTGIQVSDDIRVTRPSDSANTARIQVMPSELLELKGNSESLKNARTPAEVDAVLTDSVPNFNRADVQTRENVINLLVASPDQNFRKAMLDLVPALTQMPAAASDSILTSLNNMMPSDLSKFAERLAKAAKLNWDRLDANEAVAQAEQIFQK